MLGELWISIHAPARGATTFKGFMAMLTRDFNPRTREGCDQGQSPVHGALSDFNPRTREGCDVALMMRDFDELISIHAPARGATAVTGVSKAF